jgi:hypothetical protein
MKVQVNILRAVEFITGKSPLEYDAETSEKVKTSIQRGFWEPV